jgi:CRP-like cAMP-binding protein
MIETPRCFFSRSFDDFQVLLEKHAVCKKIYRPGSIIFSSDQEIDFCMLIERGLSSYSLIHESGAVKTLFYHSTGSLFPTYASMSSYGLLEYNVAVTEVEGWVLPQSTLRELMLSNPDLMERVLRVYLEMFNFLIFDSINQSYNSAMTRVCNFLYLYSYYVDKNAILEVDVNLTHEEISNFVAVSRVQVSYILGKLKSSGVLLTARGKIKILSMNLLRAYCSNEVTGGQSIEKIP